MLTQIHSIIGVKLIIVHIVAPTPSQKAEPERVRTNNSLSSDTQTEIMANVALTDK